MGTLRSNQEKFYCLGCQNENDFEDIINLGCAHSCCKSCVLAAAMQVLESETLEGLKCPINPKCPFHFQYPISEDLLEGLLKDEDLQKFKLIIQKYASSNPPCPKCQNEAEAEKDSFYGNCSNCNYFFCTKCRTDYHGFNCDQETEIEDGQEDLGNMHTEEIPKPPILSCLVCLENFDSSLFVEFDCGHSSTCKPCVKTYFETLICEGNVNELKCPQPNCGKEASQKLVEENVEPRLFEKYDQLLLNKALSDFPEIVNCPNQNCQRRVVADPEYGYCDHCDFRFCTECSQPYHGITGCGQTEEERRELIKRYIAADQKERDRLEKEALGLRKKQNKESEDLIKSISKKCPSCKASIEKISGCNHMHCTKCGSHFCWTCGAKITSKDPYQHFKEPRSRCSLFHVPRE